MPDKTQGKSGHDKVPTYPRAVLGYRVFSVEEGLTPLEKRLTSIHAGYIWKPGINQAICFADSFYPFPDPDQLDQHQAPASDCDCGLQAFYQLSQARRYLHEQIDRRKCHAIGLVAGRGLLQLHSIGWRAQEAQILALCIPGRAEKQTRRSISRAYLVPVHARIYRLKQTPNRSIVSVPISLRPDHQHAKATFIDTWIKALELGSSCRPLLTGLG